MPVNVGQIAESAVRSRFNPYAQPSPELHRIQGDLQAGLTNAQFIQTIGSTIQAALGIAAEKQKIKLAKDDLKVNVTENTEAYNNISDAVKTLEEQGVDVTTNKEELVSDLKDIVNEAVDVKIGTPRGQRKSARKAVRKARKEFRQAKQGIFTVDRLTGGNFKTKSQASQFLDDYELHRKVAPGILNDNFKIVQSGEYDPVQNRNREIVGYAIKNGDGGRVFTKKGKGYVEYKTQVPVKGKDGFYQYKGGKLVTEERSATFRLGKENDWFKPVLPPISSTNMTEVLSPYLSPATKEYLKKAGVLNITEGDSYHKDIMRAIKEVKKRNPDFVTSLQTTEGRRNGQEVILDSDDKIWKIYKPVANIGKYDSAGLQKLARNKGKLKGYEELGKRDIVPVKAKYNSGELKLIEKGNIAKVVDDRVRNAPTTNGVTDYSKLNGVGEIGVIEHHTDSKALGNLYAGKGYYLTFKNGTVIQLPNDKSSRDTNIKNLANKSPLDYKFDVNNVAESIKF